MPKEVFLITKLLCPRETRGSTVRAFHLHLGLKIDARTGLMHEDEREFKIQNSITYTVVSNKLITFFSLFMENSHKTSHDYCALKRQRFNLNEHR